MAKYRNVEDLMTMEVACCDHCHGDPRDCRGDSLTGSDPRDWDRALILLEKAHAAVAPGHREAWVPLALQDDIRWFLHKCGRDVIR